MVPNTWPPSGSIYAADRHNMNQPPRLRLGSYGGALSVIHETSSDHEVEVNDDAMSSLHAHQYRRSSSVPLQSLEHDDEDAMSEDELSSWQLSTSEPDLLHRHRATRSPQVDVMQTKETERIQHQSETPVQASPLSWQSLELEPVLHPNTTSSDTLHPQPRDEKKTKLSIWKRPKPFSTPRSNNTTEDKVAHQQELPKNQACNNYDSKGRCIYHPHMKLRKRRKKKSILFGGSSEWKILLTSCPDCFIDSMIKSQGYAMSENDASTASVTLTSFSESLKSNCSISTIDSPDRSSTRNIETNEGEKDFVNDHGVRLPTPSRSECSSRHPSFDCDDKCHDSCTVDDQGQDHNDGWYEISLFSTTKSTSMESDDSSIASRSSLGSSIYSDSCMTIIEDIDESSSCASAEQTLGDFQKRTSLTSQDYSVCDNSGRGLTRPENHLGNHIKTQDETTAPHPKEDEISNLMYACEMEYTDSTNNITGCYSGTVNQDFIPHGSGVMVYRDGVEIEGEWDNGRLMARA